MKEKEYRASRLMRELGAPIRYQIVKFLEGGPKTVSQIATHVDRTLATVSHHLHILRTIDVVRYDTSKKNVIYRLKATMVPALLAVAERRAAKLEIKRT